ncbi:MAG: peroxiredoxin family protein [Candidatus Glassbacteria bacterium]
MFIRVSNKESGKILLGIFFFAAMLYSSPGAATAENLKAPDFTLEKLDGSEAVLSEILKKGPVVINFWATWCKPCIRELPHLQEIYDRYKEAGVSLLAISVDSPRSLSKVKSFINGHNYTFTVLLDPNKDVSRKFNVHLFPYTFIVNTEGDIVFKNYGYRPGDEKKVEQKLLALIDEKPNLNRMEKESEGE